MGNIEEKTLKNAISVVTKYLQQEDKVRMFLIKPTEQEDGYIILFADIPREEPE